MTAVVEDATGSCNTRSLDRLAQSSAGRGGGAHDAFLSAVLFLLTAAVSTKATPSGGHRRRPLAVLDSTVTSSSASSASSSAPSSAPAPAPSPSSSPATNGVVHDEQPQQQLSSPPPPPSSSPSIPYPSASAARQNSLTTSQPESTAGNDAGTTESGNCRDWRGRQQRESKGRATSNDEKAQDDSGGDGDKREELLRSVAEAAKDTLGCGCNCFLLQNGRDDKLTCDDATVDASDGWPSEGAAVGKQEGWWSKLRQVTRGWYRQEVSAGGNFGAQDKTVGGEQGGESSGKEWIGLELSLQSSDVGHPDGQAAMMEFLKSRVTATTHTRQRRRDDAGERQAEETTPSFQGTPGDASGAAATNEAAAGGSPPTHDQRGESGMRVVVETVGMAGIRDEENDTVTAAAISHDEVALKDKVVTVDSQVSAENSRTKTIHDGKTKTETCHSGERVPCSMEAAGAEVIAAVLVFGGNELSKRERAELHRKAEDVAGVSSSSHGVGDARFLALVCAVEDNHRTVASAGPELSAEQVRVREFQVLLRQNFKTLAANRGCRVRWCNRVSCTVSTSWFVPIDHVLHPVWS